MMGLPEGREGTASRFFFLIYIKLKNKRKGAPFVWNQTRLIERVYVSNKARAAPCNDGMWPYISRYEVQTKQAVHFYHSRQYFFVIHFPFSENKELARKKGNN
jgi:hypothetical protein